MASIKRVLPALAIAAAVLLGGSTGYSKTASKPKAKPVIKAAVPAQWVTRTSGTLRCRVPSDWIKPAYTPNEVISWRVGRNKNNPAGAIVCKWQPVDNEEINELGLKDGVKTTLAGIAAVEYRKTWSEKSTCLIVLGKPQEDGKQLALTAWSATGEYKQYEPILRKIIASIEINPATTPANSSATPVNWVTKTVGRFTFSVPSDWNDKKDIPDGGCWWYIGPDEKTKLDAGFGCSWQSGSMDQYLLYPENNNRTELTISGIAATQFTFGQDDRFGGFMIVSDKPEANGKRLLIMAASYKGEFRKYETLFRKIISSIKIAPAETTPKTDPSPATP